MRRSFLMDRLLLIQGQNKLAPEDRSVKAKEGAHPASRTLKSRFPHHFCWPPPLCRFSTAKYCAMMSDFPVFLPLLATLESRFLSSFPVHFPPHFLRGSRPLFPRKREGNQPHWRLNSLALELSLSEKINLWHSYRVRTKRQVELRVWNKLPLTWVFNNNLTFLTFCSLPVQGL